MNDIKVGDIVEMPPYTYEKNNITALVINRNLTSIPKYDTCDLYVFSFGYYKGIYITLVKKYE